MRANTSRLLADGTVLLAGGGKAGSGLFPSQFGDGSVAAELMTPQQGLHDDRKYDRRPGWADRYSLADGKVLIAGGWTSSNAIATAIRSVVRSFHSYGKHDVGLSGTYGGTTHYGRVLITGGLQDQTNVDLDTADIYDPATGSFSATDS